MKKSFLFFAGTFLCLALSAQQSVMLLKAFGGDQPDVFTHLVEMDNNEIWAVGSTGSNLQSNADAWLLRTNENLECIESKTFSSSGVDRAEYVVKDEDGNAYIVGYTNGFGAQEYDALVIKVNSLGEEQWVRTYGNADWDFATCAAWHDGDLFIGGNSYVDAFSSRPWMVRIDEEGSVVSEQIWDGLTNSWINDLMHTSDGHLMVMYTEENTITGLHDTHILKLNSDGTTVWQHVRSLTTEDSQGVSFFEHNHIYFCAGKREVNGLISPFVTHLNEAGVYLEEFQMEQPDDYFVVRPMVIDDAKVYAVTTRAFGGGGSDGSFINFTPYYGFISSVTIGAAGEEYMNDAILTSSGKFVGCGEYGSFSDQLSQGMLAVLPDVNIEGYSYSLVNDAACFVVGIQEFEMANQKDYVGVWTIYDLAGRKVFSATGTKTQVTLELADLPSGLYLLCPQVGNASKILLSR